MSYLPLADASAAFALAGAAITAGCALLVFHASAGHIESVLLRALLAAALVLLPVAPMEVIGSGVDTPWYLLPALFWAVLWRPRARPAMAVAAAAGFLAMASTILAVLLAPLLAARLYVLRSPREHAVSAGWLAGALVQAAFIIPLAAGGRSRLHPGSLITPCAPAPAAPAPAGGGPETLMAVTALAAFLAATWTADFRYTGLRATTAWTWAPIAATWEHDCAHSRTGQITETIYKRPWTLPCRNITT